MYGKNVRDAKQVRYDMWWMIDRFPLQYLRGVDGKSFLGGTFKALLFYPSWPPSARLFGHFECEKHK